MTLECLDGPLGCAGETVYRESLSGSGMPFPRCDKHQAEYVAHVQPIIDDIDRRYPRTAPGDFDPLAAGERWDDGERWDEEDPWP